MDREKFKSKAQTVLGPVDSDQLGFTLPHEHLFIDTRSWFTEPADPDDKAMLHQQINLKNLSWVRSHKLSNLDNLQLIDEETAISEAKRFKKAGGNTIVDVTPNNVGRNPTGLVNAAKATGLNMIMGTAYYVEQSFTPEMRMDSRTAENIADEFVRDITMGVNGTGIYAGIIGELGCSWPLTENEKKVLRGGAVAQQETGAVISIHFQGGDENSPFEIVKVLTDAGADPSRVIMGHMSFELPVSACSIRSKLCDMGCYLEYDTFGVDGFYPLDRSPYDVACDSIRINEIIELIADGHLNNILVSQDVCFKIHLVCFGGMGYTHIPKTIVPFMRKKGLTEEQIHTITVENPKRALTLV